MMIASAPMMFAPPYAFVAIRVRQTRKAISTGRT